MTDSPRRRFLMMAGGTGGHVFSETLAEHNVAVRDLIRRQRAANKNDSP